MAETTDFGFERVPPEEKARRVRGVFESVAGKYDLMNDLMSAGLHRFWKRFTIAMSGVRPGGRVLDIAGGTADLTRLFAAGPVRLAEAEVMAGVEVALDERRAVADALPVRIARERHIEHLGEAMPPIRIDVRCH